MVVEAEQGTRSTAVKALFSAAPVLCDGAMGTMFYSRGVFFDRCYDELNVTQPDLVRALHTEYLDAGAEIIETNTFGANRLRLAHFGLEARATELNHAGLRLARECAVQAENKGGRRAFVGGAIGPVGVGLEHADEASLAAAYEAFREQVRALAGPLPAGDEGAWENAATGSADDAGLNAGVDLFLLETLTSMREAELALRAARAEGGGRPVVAMVTVDEHGLCLDGTPAEEAARLLEGWGAQAVGVNCSDGPAAVLQAVERMRGATGLPLAAMPNAGVPKVVEGRHLYLTSPEYLASYARKFVAAGVTFIGGCCGTTPKHIRSVRGTLRALGAQATGAAGAGLEVLSRMPGELQPPPLAERSAVGATLAAGRFLTLVEIVPPKGFDCSRELEGAEMLRALGVQAINVPDSPRASARMSALSLCVQIQTRVGIETVLHYTCRDRNLLSIQSDLLGAASIGLKNILCLTGDPPKMGDYPEATAVFDVDAVGLTRIVADMNRGLDLGGHPIGNSPGFTVAVAANPGVPDLDHEVRRFAAKVEAGGEYAITQPVFDLRLLDEFLRRIEPFRIPVVAGIWPLTSVKNAVFMRDELKVRMPAEILERMARSTDPAEARAEGIRIAQEMLAAAHERVGGVQVSAPFGKYKAAAEVLGLLPQSHGGARAHGNL